MASLARPMYSLTTLVVTNGLCLSSVSTLFKIFRERGGFVSVIKKDENNALIRDMQLITYLKTKEYTMGRINPATMLASYCNWVGEGC